MADAKDKSYTPEHVVDQDLVYLQKIGRPVNTGGIFLDDVQRINAEKVRAKLEGREPDLENPGSTAGTPLVNLATAAAANPKDAPIYSDVTVSTSVQDEAAVKYIEESNKLANERPETAVTPEELAVIEAQKEQDDADAAAMDEGAKEPAPAAKKSTVTSSPSK
jgi:hypothetical protein